ncbi:lytic transglycosylase domain-containing protein [Bradyrhizobium sp.]|uniref:lytic transglycosylase domain-containing protein n=1 Tax=Bradyrhizobium sp. TaxID=376 RepID=UPI00262EA6D7|nr:lytic transglycosylase domain-containing protein [Bradyrhizobium sp.]
MYDRHAHAVGGRSHEPAPIFPSRPCSPIEEPADDPQGKSHTPAIAGPIAWPGTLRVLMLVIAAIAPFVCEVTGSAFLESSARAQTVARSEAVDRFAKLIEEASGRFAVPASWVRAVMHVESGGDEHATSPRGAIGLMQLMPATWLELSVRYGLGVDPFDAHDNIIAGTAYLKDMHDRFGSAGFLAAYHAGPARYEQHLATGRPLPQETAAYVAAVTPLLDDEHTERAPVRIGRAVPWREAPLFVERAGVP